MSAAAASRRDESTGTNAIGDAAQWLATGGADKAHAILPQIRKRFNLSIADAIAAEREANLIRAGAE
ncbi:hypothetical protein [Mesorhizobium sp. B2-6-4]|uniref:hypothetical protein n=1 Tax=Mesorhizobium sp. B2-6-4 TaxID=2589913 RepID=UPI00112D9777|nr:hypothetical protein [Mesorhizobium sp. B2-6-4]TPJ52734.1 hypothetical protein FJ426_15905 [Mesorhizobium sp. B2-6-4]